MSLLKPIVLSGPSGGGKSTIFERAKKEYPDAFAFSVSHTTRKPRPGEENGVHYWFVERGEMGKMINGGEFLENAQFGGNLYGTSKKSVEDVQRTGRICVLDLELQGEERLRKRGTETEESIKKRIQHAREDLEAVKSEPSLFDNVIVNDDLEKAYKEFLNILSDDLSHFKRLESN